MVGPMMSKVFPIGGVGTDGNGIIVTNGNPTDYVNIRLTDGEAFYTASGSSGGSGTATTVNIGSYGGSSTTLGQKSMAASIPTTIASDQTFTFVQTLGGTVPADAIYVGFRDNSGNIQFGRVFGNASTINTSNNNHLASLAQLYIKNGSVWDPVTGIGSNGITVTGSNITIAQVPTTNVSITGPLGQKAKSASIPFTLASDQEASYIDAGNSTTTPLSGNATYTGTGFDALGFTTMNVQAFADVNGADGGLRIQSSTDSTNWDHQHTFTVDNASAGYHLNYDIPSRYIRVIYVNGTAAQSTFRLATKFNRYGGQQHVHEVDYAITDNHPAPVNRSVIAGKDVISGTYKNLSLVTASGVNFIPAIIADLDFNTPDIKPTGEFYSLVGATNQNKTAATYLLTDSDGRVQTSANAVTITSIPTTNVSQASVWTLTANNSSTSVDTIVQTYSDNTSRASSSAYICSAYRWATFGFQGSMANAPTTLQFIFSGSIDGTNYEIMRNGPIGSMIYDDVILGTGNTFSVIFPINHHAIKVGVSTIGNTNSKTFTITRASLRFSY